MDFNKGGQEVIKRLLTAYGFKTRQALCDQLGASASTMSTRWMRDVFPADWVIQCSMETGASLQWLSFGTGEPFPNGSENSSKAYFSSANENALNDVMTVQKKKIVDGNLYDANFYMLDKAMVPSHISKPIIVVDDDVQYLAEQNTDEISDGTWLIEVEGQVSVKELTRIPVGRVLVKHPTKPQSFECGIEDLKPIAKCYYRLMTDV
ncbi:phage repressor protein CI [Cronobacter sakazakii]|uniref:phage repressor protein CI n=1 Tax=Cronobacter sakazakii TaxID=28141 RepID=UPI0004A93A47|nr:phage repressor protein CI [Cronobacter sakazakii]KAB0855631.1 CI repressor [Cronobacter sakazakii]KDP97101.1 CI repressor [Cronobacter sakazakii]MDK1285319.1 phage repressor protein CI [Cronobacter sakazakii]